jgi:hypothetical protein
MRALSCPTPTILSNFEPWLIVEGDTPAVAAPEKLSPRAVSNGV